MISCIIDFKSDCQVHLTMPTQMLVSDETLAEVFVETNAELSFQMKLEEQGSIAPEGKVTTLFDAFPGEFTDSFKRSATIRFPIAAVQVASLESENIFRIGWEWLKDKFRGAKDRLLELAKQIKKESDRLGISISEFLARMRRRMYRWLIRNSAIETFDIGDDPKSRITFRPATITTKGNFEFGRIDKDFATIGDILAFLKIMPTISVGIDVQYESK